jgi:hypothetical protein
MDAAAYRRHSAYWQHGYRHGIYGKQMPADELHCLAERDINNEKLNDQL